jgi:ketosteroid isomerase-like protein
LPAPLARVLTDYEAAWSRKDAAALAALFAEDGFVLSSGTPPVRGRAAIERHYMGQGGPLALRALAFSTHGPIGFIIGGFARAKGEPGHRQVHAHAREGAAGPMAHPVRHGQRERAVALSGPRLTTCARRP